MKRFLRLHASFLTTLNPGKSRPAALWDRLYNTGTVFIRFIGTHADYDKIDASTI